MKINYHLLTIFEYDQTLINKQQKHPPHNNILKRLLLKLAPISTLGNIFHPTSFNTMMRFQQKDKSLIVSAKQKPKHYSIKQFHEPDKTYTLLCENGKI